MVVIAYIKYRGAEWKFSYPIMAFGVATIFDMLPIPYRHIQAVSIGSCKGLNLLVSGMPLDWASKKPVIFLQPLATCANDLPCVSLLADLWT